MAPDKIEINLARKILLLEMDKEYTKKFFYNIPRGRLHDRFEVYKLYENIFDELIKNETKSQKAKEEIEKFYN